MIALAKAFPLDASMALGFFGSIKALSKLQFDVATSLTKHLGFSTCCWVCHGSIIGPFFDKNLNFFFHLLTSLLLLCQHVILDSFAKSKCFKGFHFFFLWDFLCETHLGLPPFWLTHLAHFPCLNVNLRWNMKLMAH